MGPRLLVIAFSCLCLLGLVNCRGYLSLQFLRYNNHDSRCSDGTFCDTVLFFNSRESRCDPQFLLTADRYSSGRTGMYNYQQTGWYQDRDVIDFGSNFAGIPNPVPMAMNYDNNNGLFYIRVRVMDKDMSINDLIDIFYATLYPSGADVKHLTLVSHAMGHTLTLKYWYTCYTFYHGALCNTFCQAQDSAAAGHYTCDANGQKVCRNGWIGAATDCKTPHPCSTAGVCQNGGTCGLDGESYSCRCPADYSGRNCETFLNPCTYRNPCKNGATCHLDSSSQPQCRCPTDYSGRNCETFLNPCTYRNPCKNGATCHLDASNQPQCGCLPQFTGTHCDADVNECSADEPPCSNGMPCVNTRGGFYCNCTDVKFHGSRCELDHCNSTLCLNNGTCEVSSENGVPQCLCPEGFTDENCETANPCYSSPCQNGATCRNTAAGFECDCPLEFTGDRCETANPCHSSPCQNGATCRNTAAGFECDCPAKFKGDRCETARPNYCASGPCLNGGSCISDADGFNCSCRRGFEGALCQLSPLSTTSKAPVGPTDPRKKVGNPSDGQGAVDAGISVAGVAAGCVIGFLLLAGFGVFLGVYLLRERRRLAESPPDDSNSDGMSNPVYNNASNWGGTVRSHDALTVQMDEDNQSEVYEPIAGEPIGEQDNQEPTGEQDNQEPTDEITDNEEPPDGQVNQAYQIDA